MLDCFDEGDVQEVTDKVSLPGSFAIYCKGGSAAAVAAFSAILTTCGQAVKVARCSPHVHAYANISVG